MLAIFSEGIYSSRLRIMKIEGTTKRWILKKKNGYIEEIEPIQWISLFSCVILLRYREKKKKIHTLLIFNDSTTPEAFHQGLLLSR